MLTLLRISERNGYRVFINGFLQEQMSENNNKAYHNLIEEGINRCLRVNLFPRIKIYDDVRFNYTGYYKIGKDGEWSEVQTIDIDDKQTIINEFEQIKNDCEQLNYKYEFKIKVRINKFQKQYGLEYMSAEDADVWSM